MSQITNQSHRLPKTLHLPGGRELSLERPLVMGILNVTPDSFSDGGNFLAVDHAVGYALKMVEEGADIIDIGGESTRPGSEPVPLTEELRRVVPVFEAIRKLSAVVLSVDTQKAEVARAAVAAGADIINDISALRTDEKMPAVAGETGAPVVLMHMQGTPQFMQQNPYYDDCVEEVAAFFSERVTFAVSHGLEREKLILDPGIGFGKRLQDNLILLKQLNRFAAFGLPLLVGASRKSFISKVSEIEKPAIERLGGSVAAAAIAVLHGAQIVRVHDVAQTVEAVRVTQAVRGQT